MSHSISSNNSDISSTNSHTEQMNGSSKELLDLSSSPDITTNGNGTLFLCIYTDLYITMYRELRSLYITI